MNKPVFDKVTGKAVNVGQVIDEMLVDGGLSGLPEEGGSEPEGKRAGTLVHRGLDGATSRIGGQSEKLFASDLPIDTAVATPGSLPVEDLQAADQSPG